MTTSTGSAARYQDEPTKIFHIKILNHLLPVSGPAANHHKVRVRTGSVLERGDSQSN